MKINTNEQRKKIKNIHELQMIGICYLNHYPDQIDALMLHKLQHLYFDQDLLILITITPLFILMMITRFLHQLSTGLNACRNMRFSYPLLCMKLLGRQVFDKPDWYPMSQAPSLNAMLRKMTP